MFFKKDPLDNIRNAKSNKSIFKAFENYIKDNFSQDPEYYRVINNLNKYLYEQSSKHNIAPDTSKTIVLSMIEYYEDNKWEYSKQKHKPQPDKEYVTQCVSEYRKKNLSGIEKFGALLLTTGVLACVGITIGFCIGLPIAAVLGAPLILGASLTFGTALTAILGLVALQAFGNPKENVGIFMPMRDVDGRPDEISRAVEAVKKFEENEETLVEVLSQKVI